MASRPPRPDSATPRAMREVLTAYVEAVNAGDADAVLALFSDSDAVFVEDPAGSDPHRGRAAVDAFYQSGLASSRPQLTVSGPVCTTGVSEAALPFRMRVTTARGTFEADVTDVMRFDAEGRILSMRALWNPRELRSVG